MQPRIRRLTADFNRVQDSFGTHAFVRVASTEGDPPEKYLFILNVPGLIPDGDDIAESELHKVEVFLPLDYPRCAPFCRMASPVFHPNIDPQKICIGDHWSAGQTLDSMIVRIAEMICYQSYNVKSPLNAKAAAWVEQNMDKVPLMAGDLSPTGS